MDSNSIIWDLSISAMCLPHAAWSRMGVTMPAVTQFTVEAEDAVVGRVILPEDGDGFLLTDFIRY